MTGRIETNETFVDFIGAKVNKRIGKNTRDFGQHITDELIRRIFGWIELAARWLDRTGQPRHLVETNDDIGA